MCAQVRAAAPEVLVVARAGADPAGALGEVSDLAALPGWWGLPAVKAGRVYVADAACLLRPGPRLVLILPSLAAPPTCTGSGFLPLKPYDADMQPTVTHHPS